MKCGKYIAFSLILFSMFDYHMEVQNDFRHLSLRSQYHDILIEFTHTKFICIKVYQKVWGFGITTEKAYSFEILVFEFRATIQRMPPNNVAT